MKFLTPFFGSLALLCLFGCSTILMEDGSDADNAPAGSLKGKKGKVAYNPNGPNKIVQFRRNNALKNIVNLCGSNKYKILSETIQDADDVDTDFGTFLADEVKVVEFQCQ